MEPLFASQSASPDEHIETAMNGPVIMGTLFENSDIPYILGGVVVGVIQPFVVGKVLPEGNTAVAVNVVAGVAALGVGLAARTGYIDSIPREANAALIGYGASILAMVLLGELMKYWDKR